MAEDDVRFTVTYGSQSFKRTSAKISALAFMARGNGTDNMVEDKPLFLNKVMARPAGTNTVPMYASRAPTDKNGMWYRQEYLGREGDIVGLRLYATINGGLRAHSIILIQLRADGDYMNVKAQVPTAAEAAFSTEVPAFTGRGDIVTPWQARRLGAVFSESMQRNYMDPEEVEEDFTVEVMSKGTKRPKTSRVAVRDGKGGTKGVIVKKPNSRRIRVRRD